MSYLIVQIVVWFIIGLYAGRAIVLFVIASKKAKRARTDMLNAPTWTPSPLEFGFSRWHSLDFDRHFPNQDLPDRDAERSALRDERRMRKATEYAQALQDRRRAFAWPYWAITARQAEKREANLILREVIAQQTMKALEELKHEADERTKDAS